MLFINENTKLCCFQRKRVEIDYVNLSSINTSHIFTYNTIQSPTVVPLTIPFNNISNMKRPNIMNSIFQFNFRDLLLSINKCFVVVWHIERLEYHILHKLSISAIDCSRCSNRIPSLSFEYRLYCS